MPHAGLMDPGALGPELAALQRARLHLRGGRRRLRQGKVSAGLVTLHDTLAAALDWFFASPARRRRLPAGDQAPADDASRLAALVRSGILDGSFDYAAFDRLVDRALDEEVAGVDWSGVLRGVESVLAGLGVLPFDEESLPPEDPRTF